MPNPIASFTDAAKNLSGNPLGIIALFIVLVYGIAALVFGFSGEHLSDNQRWLMIWFLVLFPVLVLSLFGWMVARHHTKLYAPTDYQDDEGFFRALTPFEHKQKIQDIGSDASESMDTNAINESIPIEINQDDTEAVLKQEMTLDGGIYTNGSDVARKDIPKIENKDIIKRRLEYIATIDLLMRDMKDRIGTNIVRDVKFQYENIFVPVDGTAIKGDKKYVIFARIFQKDIWEFPVHLILSRIAKMHLISKDKGGVNFCIALVFKSFCDSPEKRDSEIEKYINNFIGKEEFDIPPLITLYTHEAHHLYQKYGIN